MRLSLAGMAALLSFAAAPLFAQRSTSPLPRWGVVAGFGFGGGSGAVTCPECHGSRMGRSAHGRVGGALREDLLLMAELDGFASSTPSVAADAATSLIALNIVAQWYPNPARGYFVSAGVGGGRVEADAPSLFADDVRSPIGAAFRIGTGYDFAVTRALAVTPFASFVHVDAGVPKNGTKRMSGRAFLVGVEANLFTRQLMGSN
jgi:hypothetical protein